MIKLSVKQNQKTIPMSSLIDGQMAEVIDHQHTYTGVIVQRHGDDAVAIGLSKGSRWSGINNVNLLVRVLEEGETLIITDNQ